MFIIEGDSSAITNAICPSLSVNYGSVTVYKLPLHLKTGDGELNLADHKPLNGSVSPRIHYVS